MRETSESMGPLFVKVMQFVSVRGEGLDPEILEELVKLQDSVTPFDSISYQDLLTSYGVPRGATPIACGSVAAVYKGVMTDGREVAIKARQTKSERGLLARTGRHAIHLPDPQEVPRGREREHLRNAHGDATGDLGRDRPQQGGT